MRGVLGITDRHVPDVNTRGTVDVYIARMFIAGGHRDLLPSWARFIQGVIDLLIGLADERAALSAEKEALSARLREAEGSVPSQSLAPAITCYVAMPFEKILDPVFEALRLVLADVPYV